MGTGVLLAVGIDTDRLPWLEEADGDGLTPEDVFFDRVRERFEIREPVTPLDLFHRQGQGVPYPVRLRAAGLIRPTVAMLLATSAQPGWAPTCAVIRSVLRPAPERTGTPAATSSLLRGNTPTVPAISVPCPRASGGDHRGTARSRVRLRALMLSWIASCRR